MEGVELTGSVLAAPNTKAPVEDEGAGAPNTEVVLVVAVGNPKGNKNKYLLWQLFQGQFLLACQKAYDWCHSHDMGKKIIIWK